MPTGVVTTSQAARDIVAATPFDPSLMPGARSAIAQCLGVKADEQVAIIAEPEQGHIAASLLRAAEDLGASTVVYIVHGAQASAERFAQRVAERVAECDASVLLATVHGLSTSFRRRIISAGGDRRRHGHMVGLTEPMMLQGMRADYEEVRSAGERLIARLARGKKLTVASVTGTELEVTLEPRHHWYNASGLIAPGAWGNLPGGEVYTAPASVDGVMCPDGGVWLPDGTELGRGGRLRLVFEGGSLVRCEGKEADAAQRLLAIADDAPNGRRIGQVAFGTNVAVLTPIGALLQDLKMPGFHMALGETYREHTAAGWSSTIEIPLLLRRADVMLDGEPLMLRGRYVHDE